MSSDSIIEPITLRKFKLQAIVGQGAFGKVKIIEDKTTKTLYALKYMNKEEIIKRDALQFIFRERILLHQLDHPFIVKITHCFQDDENLFIALQLARGGDLRFNMNHQKEFDEHTMRVYVGEIALAIDYMHSKMIIHRDLKPENILLDEDGHILLTDLNLATSLKKRKPASNSGTLDYMAPEMLIRQPYGYSIDWWALGTILFEISYKYLPFGGEDKEIITNNIKNMELVFPNDVKSVKYPRTEEEIQTRNSFIGGLLDRNVDARLGSSNDGLGFEKDIKTHPYLESINWDQLLNRKVKPTFKPSNTKDPTNYAPNLMIGEMLGGSETLSYRPRKKKRDPNQQSFGEKLSSLFALKKKSSIVGGSTDSLSRAPTKLKSKSQIQQENMDNYWTDYDYENDAYSQPCKMPPSSDDTKTALGSTAVLDGSLSASPSFNFTGFGTNSKDSDSTGSLSHSESPSPSRGSLARVKQSTAGRSDSVKAKGPTSPLRKPVNVASEPSLDARVSSIGSLAL